MPASSNSKSQEYSRRGWTTPEQRRWLRTRIDAYKARKPDAKLFWKALYEGWYACWPAGSNAEKAPIEKRLREWFNNNTRGTFTPEVRKRPLDLNRRSTKKRSSVQAYIRLYHKKKLKPIVDHRWAQHITKHPDLGRKKGEYIRFLNVVAKEQLDVETDEVKAEVERRREEGDLSDEDIESDDDHGAVDATERERRTTARGYHRGQMRLRSTIESTMQAIQNATGLVGFILVGGPEPQRGGELMIMSSHVGTNKSGLDFSQSYSGWNPQIQRPFLAHLNNVFSREMRQDRALPGTGSTNLEGLIKMSDVGDDAGEQEDCQPEQEDHDSERADCDSEREGRDSEQADRDSERVDQNSEQEVTEASEQEKPEEGTSTLDYLSDRVGWPRWFKDGIEHLEIISTVGAWSTLLSSFVKLEMKLGFADAGRIDAKDRPREVAMWMKKGRKYALTPIISEPAAYKESWKKWWEGLQPDWRKLGDGIFLQDVPATGEEWDALHKGGQNGFFMVIMAFSWWVEAMGRVFDDAELRDALDDLTWAVNRMGDMPALPDQLIGQKRALEDELDISHTRKRHKRK